jgi:hypothetical protein
MKKKRAKKAAPPPAGPDGSSGLTNLANHLNRLLLHGSRVDMGQPEFRPATVATGQQIKVNLPAPEGIRFAFNVPSTPQVTVPLDMDAAPKWLKAMQNAVGPDAALYFNLSPDESIPTWAFHQKEFSLPANPTPEQLLKMPAVTGFKASQVLLLPQTVLQENQMYHDEEQTPVSLWLRNKKPTVQFQSWTPAISLTFGLKPATTTSAPTLASATGQLYEIAGTPQADRWFLDRLHPGQGLPAGITGVTLNLFALADDGTATALSDWLIVRNNLTSLARPQSRFRMAFEDITRPYLAIDGDTDNALLLLQMLSITNSGGYYLQATAGAAPKSLAAVIRLTLQGDSMLPKCANAIVYESPANPNGNPSTMRFDGIKHVEVQSFAQPGSVVVGWKRVVPATNPDATDREGCYGYQTVSMVDFTVATVDGNWLKGSQGQSFNGDSVVALSPTSALRGTAYPAVTPPPDGHAAAMKLVGTDDASSVIPTALSPSAPPSTIFHYYRTTIPVSYTSESPYASLADSNRKTLAFTAGFRDVFGNTILPQQKRFASQSRRLFYTDPLINLSEWPGFRFTLAPLQFSGAPALILQASYTLPKKNVVPGQPAEGAQVAFEQQLVTRKKQLAQIRLQLIGAQSDVKVLFKSTLWSGDAPPSKQSPPPPPAEALASQKDVTDTLLAILNEAIDLVPPPTKKEPDSGKPDAVRTVAIVNCDQAIPSYGPKRFQPELVVSRTSFIPAPGDYPADDTLREAIHSAVTEAHCPLYLIDTPVPNPQPMPLRARRVAAGPSADASMKEFKKVAETYYQVIGQVKNFQVGIRRNLANQHELWLIHNDLFPKAKASTRLRFATPRPLRNQLESGTFQFPDFSQKPLAKATGKSKTVIDADYDELGRAVFLFLEQTALSAQNVSGAMGINPDVTDLIKKSLGVKEEVAKTLGAFAQDGTSGYVVPLFINSGQVVEPASIVRATTDMFCQDLRGFYRLDTIVQLELEKPATQAVYSFYGVSCPLKEVRPASRLHNANPAQPKPASLSDFEIWPKENFVTLLYQAPRAESLNPLPGPVLENIKTTITHLQLQQSTLGQPASSKADTSAAFAENAWLELIVPKPLAWTLDAADTKIPMILRRFPQNPVIVDCNIPTPPQTATVDTTTAKKLSKWGWEINFLVEGLPQDSVAITVNYNNSEIPTQRAAAFLSREVSPPVWCVSLLHALLSFKELAKVWTTPPASTQREWLYQLLFDLSHFLNPKSMTRMKQDAVSIQDKMFYYFSDKTFDFAGNQVMGSPVAKLTQQEQLTNVLIQADVDKDANNAYMLASKSVFNFKPQLILQRNAFLKGRKSKQDVGPETTKSLVYTCSSVEPAFPILACNSWNAIKFSTPQTPANLQETLTDFFVGLLNGASLDDLQIHVVASFGFSSGNLQIIDPYRQIPVDFTMEHETSTDWAARVTREILLYWNARMGVPLPDPLPDPTKSIIIILPPCAAENEAKVWLQLNIHIGRKSTEIPAGRMQADIKELTFELIPPPPSPAPTPVKSLLVRRKARTDKSRTGRR